MTFFKSDIKYINATNFNTMTDPEILIILQSERPQKALKKLYDYFPQVKRFISKHGGNTDDAHDIFQDALLVLLDKIKQNDFQLSSSLNTYLFSISKYKWKAILISKNKLNDYLIDFSEEETSFNSENESQYKHAEKALALLGKKCQDILVAFYHHKLSMTVIAEKFGFTSENVAKNQKYKCLEKARDEYKSLLLTNL